MSKLLVILLCCLGVVTAKPHFESRIIGGQEAKEGQFPYQVSVRFLGEHICGGTIISSRYILTAAHCGGEYDSAGTKFLVYKPETLTILAGSNDRLAGGVVAQVDNNVVHEDYGNELHDFAIMRLETPLTFSQNIKAISLAQSEVPVGETVTFSGWGFEKNNGTMTTKLKWNTAKAISRADCYKEVDLDSDAVLCLAHPANNGLCSYDSGGPATYKDTLVGTASFVWNDCGGASADGFAKVFTHLDWIKKHSDVK